MPKVNPALSYNLQEILRQMFRCGTDMLLYRDNRGYLLLDKEFLINQLSRQEELSLGGVISMAAAGFTPELPEGRSDRVMCVTNDGFTESTLDVLRISPAPVMGLPVWWDIPIPIARKTGSQVVLNGAARSMIRERDVQILSKVLSFETQIELPSGMSVLLHPLEDGFWRIEDVSEDCRMAMDLAWWAAVGYSMVERMRNNGLSVERTRDPAKQSGEVVPCFWEGELMGYLCFNYPQAAPQKVEEPPKSDEPPVPPKAEAKKQKKKSTPKNKPLVVTPDGSVDFMDLIGISEHDLYVTGAKTEPEGKGCSDAKEAENCPTAGGADKESEIPAEEQKTPPAVFGDLPESMDYDVFFRDIPAQPVFTKPLSEEAEVARQVEAIKKSVKKVKKTS